MQWPKENGQKDNQWSTEYNTREILSGIQMKYCSFDIKQQSMKQ